MRLICPNCGAQYEVADDVIPVAGRDVQCSNCGHTWFEQPGASEAAEAGAPLPPPAAIAEDWAEPVAATPVPRQAAPQPAAPVPADDDLADLNLQPEALPPDPVPPNALPPNPGLTDPLLTDPIAAAAQRRGLSAELAEMLRDEAARESAARAAEAPAEPARPSLMPPLTTDDPRDDDVRRRTARLRGEEAGVSPRPVTPATRRELLPDIEMINSSLRPASEDDHAAAAEPALQSRKRGARFGFTTVILIVAILVGLYIGAPRIIAVVPAAEPVLTRYVAVVDEIRLWIDLKMQDFIAAKSGTDSTTAPDTAPDTVPDTVPATDPPATEPPTLDAPAPGTEPPATEQSNG